MTRPSRACKIFLTPDHPLQVVPARMIHGKRQRGKGLATASGHGQREQPRCLGGPGAHMGKDFGPDAVDVAFRLVKLRQMRLQRRGQIGQCRGGQMAQCGSQSRHRIAGFPENPHPSGRKRACT